MPQAESRTTTLSAESSSGLGPWARGSARASAFFLFSFVAAIAVLKAVTNSLLLTAFSPAILPYLYVATPLAVALGLSLVLRPRSRVRLPVGAFAAAACVVAGYFALPRFPAWSELALYLFGEAAATSISVAFWEEQNLLFDARSAKRLFGPVSAAGMAGSVLGGLLVSQLSLPLGTRGLLPLAAAALVLAGVAALILAREARRAGPDDTELQQALPSDSSRQAAGPSTWLAGFRLLGGSYPRLVAGLVLLFSILTVAVDFLFRSRAHALLHADQLTRVFGSVSIVVGLFSIAVQLLLSGPLLRHAGLRSYLLIIVGGLAAVAVAAWGARGHEPAGFALLLGAGVFAFAPVYLLKVVENSSSLSLSLPATQLLYHPLPPAERVVLRGLIDGFLKKLGIALGGASLLVFLPLAARFSWAQRLMNEEGILLLCLLSAALIWRLARAYEQRLRSRVLLRSDAQREEHRTLTEEDRSALSLALRSSDPASALTALGVIERSEGFDLQPFLSELVLYPSRKVRRKALARVPDGPLRIFLFRLAIEAELAEDAAEAFRGEVSDPEGDRGRLEALLRHPTMRVRLLAVEGLYPLEESERDPAHQTLKAAVVFAGRTGDVGERLALVELIERLGRPDLAPSIRSFLNDRDPEVARAALRVAARYRPPELMPKLLDMLEDRARRPGAAQALVGYGDQVVDHLELRLNDRNRPLEQRLPLPRLLRRIGTQEAARVLLFSNIEDDPFLRARIAEALGHLRRERPELRFDPSWPEQAIQRRLNSLDYYLPVYLELLDLFDPHQLLMRLLHGRLAQNVDVVLRVLSLIIDPEEAHAIRVRWTSGTRHQRADALTLLEARLPLHLRERLPALLERYERLRNEGLLPTEHADPAAPAGLRVRRAAMQAWYRRQGHDGGEGGPLARSRGRADVSTASAGALSLPPGGEARPQLSPAMGSLVSGRVQSAPPLSAAWTQQDPLSLSGRFPSAPALSTSFDDRLTPRLCERLRELARTRDDLLRRVVRATVRTLDAKACHRLGPLSPTLESEMDSTYIDRVLFLQSVDLFETLDVDDLLAIAGIVEERTFHDGAVIYREGDPSDALYIVMQGDVELSLGGKPVMAVTPLESFGQLSMLDRKPRPVTATAKGDIMVLALDRSEFFELVHDRSELMQGVVVVLVKRVRALLDELARHESGPSSAP